MVFDTGYKALILVWTLFKLVKYNSNTTISSFIPGIQNKFALNFGMSFSQEQNLQVLFFIV